MAHHNDPLGRGDADLGCSLLLQQGYVGQHGHRADHYPLHGLGPDPSDAGGTVLRRAERCHTGVDGAVLAVADRLACHGDRRVLGRRRLYGDTQFSSASSVGSTQVW